MNTIKKFLIALANILDFTRLEAEQYFGICNVLLGLALYSAPTNIGTAATVEQLTNKTVLSIALSVSGIVIMLPVHFPKLKKHTFEIFMIFALPFVAFASISIGSAIARINQVTVPIASIVYLCFFFLTAKNIFDKHIKGLKEVNDGSDITGSTSK